MIDDRTSMRVQPTAGVSLPKSRLQNFQGFLEYFREAVFDQTNLILFQIERLRDLRGRDLLDGLEEENLVVLRAGLLFYFLCNVA
jgi:hypothetical protein